MTNRPELARRVAALRGVPLLAAAPDVLLERLAPRCVLRRYADGALVVSKGRPIEGLAVILRGSLRLSTLSTDGREIVYSVMPRGKVWGVVAAFDGEGATHDTRAQGLTELLVVPGALLRATFDEVPILYRALARLLAHRVRKAHGLVDDLALVALRRRLARQLCLLGVTMEGGTGRLRVTQSDLAGMVGASRQAVNRELRAMQTQGLVALGYRGVDILDRQRLLDSCETKDLFFY